MIRVHYRNEDQVVNDEYSDDVLEFGRSLSPHDPENPVARVVIKDPFASRHHARLELFGENGLTILNLSSSKPITLADESKINPGKEFNHDEPTLCFWLGKTWIEIDRSEEQIEFSGTLSARADSGIFDSVWQKYGEAQAPTVEFLTRWFETLITVQRAAAGAANFYHQACEATVEKIGFERAIVLLKENHDWTVVGKSQSIGAKQPKFSRRLLRQVVERKKTFFQTGEQLTSLSEGGLAAAAPIFDADGREIIGAVYATRGIQKDKTQITTMDAQLLQTLASVVSLGIVRTEKEKQVSKLQVKFDQFFSPKLSRELERDPGLLEGREQIITVLFGDLRNFTKYASGLSPSETCNVITDVLECMTACIRRSDGVVVDYAGDGIMAIWNAPTEQINHAELAALSAKHIIKELPKVSQKWIDKFKVPFRVGIGINTGSALVGNTGTSYKFKYGPLGHVVNLASRIESATKHIGVPIMITQSTRDLIISDEFLTRRLIPLRVVGVDDPVSVYELYGGVQEQEWKKQRDIYEDALEQFESGQWARASQTIQPLLYKSDLGEGDLPSLMLAGKAIECLKSPPENFEAVIDLVSK